MSDTQINTQEAFYEEKQVEEEKTQFLSFYLNDEWYGIELDQLKEIFPLSTITRLPGAPSQVIGLVNYRGQVFPVIDLKRVFGLTEKTPSDRCRLLVVEKADTSVCLLVDTVGKVVDVPKEKIDLPLTTLSGPAAGYLKGEIQTEGGLLGILKIDQIMQGGKK
jgi:purine-binding chemotaxis protein CheW